MGPLAAGQVILLRFPFSDLSGSKLRPALILAGAGRTDWIACQITSNPYADPYAIALNQPDFAQGSLKRPSYIRPGKLFTAYLSLVVAQVASIQSFFLERVRDAVVAILRESGT